MMLLEELIFALGLAAWTLAQVSIFLTIFPQIPSLLIS